MPNVIEHTATLPREISDASVSMRAGFWRRAFAFSIDTLIVSVVLQLMVVFLFFATSGRVQILGDLSYTSCSVLKSVPNGLVPPPPAGVNYARECNVTFFGAPTAKILQVGQTKVATTAKDAAATTAASKADILKTYMLDRDGRPVDGILLDWFAGLVLIVYLVAMETRSGATLGSRAMGIRVIDAAAPAGSGVPLRKIALRYGAMLIGCLPIVAVLLVYFGLYAAPDALSTWLVQLGRQDALFDELKSNALQWQPFLSSYLVDLPGMLLRDSAVALGNIEWLFDIAALALKGWIIFLIVQIVRRRDPVYDSIAGTSVVRT
jgi:uncharacterized RDD family membrane protein YckC